VVLTATLFTSALGLTQKTRPQGQAGITFAPWTLNTTSPGCPACAGSTPAGSRTLTPDVLCATRGSSCLVNRGSKGPLAVATEIEALLAVLADFRIAAVLGT